MHTPRPRHPLAAALMVLLAALSHAPASAQESGVTRSDDRLTAAVGDMRFTYTREAGVTVEVHGIEIIRGNTFYVMKPGWTGKVYRLGDSPDLFSDARVTDLDHGGKAITLRLQTPPDTPNPFRGTLTIRLAPDNAIDWELTYQLDEGAEAIMEWGVAQLNATPLIGSRFEGVTWDGQAVAGTVPVESPGAELDVATLADGIKTLTIHSRIGPIVIRGNDPASLRLFDYRKNVWASDGKPIFWLGRLGHPLPTGERITYTAAIDFPDDLDPVSTIADPAAATVAPRPVPDARVPAPPRDFIIPQPRELRFTGPSLPLTPETRIYVGSSPTPDADRAVAFLMRDLREKFDLYPEVVRRDPPEPLPPGALVIGRADRLPRAAAELRARDLHLPDHDQGYALWVGDAAVLSAPTDRGLFHGVTTLTQLLAADDRGVALRGAEIRDWPALDFRGVHALSGRDAGDEIARAVRDLLARFKLNTFVWETQYIIWDAHPDIAHSRYGMTKTDAARVVHAAEQNLVDIIPLIQSLGHSEYIFTHGHNLELAEDPDHPYAYSPEHPGTYDFIFALYDEALAFFNQPDVFHIGHDEVDQAGRFPYRSRESGKDTYQLVLEDIHRLHGWFAERGVRMMMWSDMFLAPGEAPDATFAPSREKARELRAALPSDILIADWHYDPVPPEQLTSLRLWKDAGFEVVGCPWYQPANIRSQALQATRVGARGTLQTTWAGFNFGIAGNEANWYQYWVYLLAAHYAWSGDTTPPGELPWSAREVFLDTWFGGKPLTRDRPGFTLPLEPLANRSLTDDAGSGWLGLGQTLDFRGLDPGQTRFRQTRFDLGTNARGDTALMLAGWLNPRGAFPRQAELRLDEPRPASALRVLMNTAYAAAEGTPVGRITARFADGRTETLTLRYGVNAFAASEDRQGADARIAWQGPTAAGDTLRLWDLAWPFDTPGRLASITFHSAHTEAAPTIFAVTAVE